MFHLMDHIVHLKRLQGGQSLINHGIIRFGRPDWRWLSRITFNKICQKNVLSTSFSWLQKLTGQFINWCWCDSKSWMRFGKWFFKNFEIFFQSFQTIHNGGHFLKIQRNISSNSKFWIQDFVFLYNYFEFAASWKKLGVRNCWSKMTHFLTAHS